MTSSCKAWDLLVSSRSRGGKLYFCPTQDPLPFFAQPDWASWCSSTCTYTAIRLRGRTGHTDCSSDSSGFFLQRKVRNRDMKAHILLSPISRVRTGTPQAICDKTEAPKPAMRILRLHFSLSLTHSHTSLSHPVALFSLNSFRKRDDACSVNVPKLHLKEPLC